VRCFSARRCEGTPRKKKKKRIATLELPLPGGRGSSERRRKERRGLLCSLPSSSLGITPREEKKGNAHPRKRKEGEVQRASRACSLWRKREKKVRQKRNKKREGERREPRAADDVRPSSKESLKNGKKGERNYAVLNGQLRSWPRMREGREGWRGGRKKRKGKQNHRERDHARTCKSAAGRGAEKGKRKKVFAEGREKGGEKKRRRGRGALVELGAPKRRKKKTVPKKKKKRERENMQEASITRSSPPHQFVREGE